MGRRVDVFGRIWEVVGVVADIAPLTVGQSVAPAIYPPLSQMPSEFFTVVVRSRVGTETASSYVMDAVGAIDPELAPYDVMPLDDVVRRVTAPPRLAAALGIALGGVSVLLAASGILAILTLSVRLRRREIGVRLALGARPAAIRRDHVRRGLRLAGLGLLIGLPTAMMASRALRGLLYGIGTIDVATYAWVTGAVLAVAACASYRPARQAARVDPQSSLRADEG